MAISTAPSWEYWQPALRLVGVLQRRLPVFTGIPSNICGITQRSTQTSGNKGIHQHMLSRYAESHTVPSIGSLVSRNNTHFGIFAIGSRSCHSHSLPSPRHFHLLFSLQRGLLNVEGNPRKRVVGISGSDLLQPVAGVHWMLSVSLPM